MEEQKNTWGGARKGSGRKPDGSEKKVTLAVVLPPDIKDKLITTAKNQGISVGQLIERLAENL